MSMIPTRQPEVLRRVLEAFALDLHTAVPGMFRSYDAATQTGDVLIGVRRVNPGIGDDDPDETETFPILPAVPVIWPFSGGYFSHFPVTAGDGCLVVFCEADINAWRSGNGQDVDPGLATRHGLSGAVALPGLSWRGRTIQSADSSGARFGRDGGPQILVTASDVQAGGTSTIAKASQTDAQLAALAADIAAIASGYVPSGSPYTPTITAIRTANPIATSTLKGG